MGLYLDRCFECPLKNTQLLEWIFIYYANQQLAF